MLSYTVKTRLKLMPKFLKRTSEKEIRELGHMREEKLLWVAGGEIYIQ